MDWQVKSASKQSEVTGRAFKPGERIVSYLFKNERGDLQRSDVLAEEAQAFQSPGLVLGKWEHVVKEDISEAEIRSQSLRTSEGLFLSLFEGDGEATEEREVLKYLIAIILERKRILKPIGSSGVGGSQTYLMRGTKEKFNVPTVDVTADIVVKLKEQLRSCL